MNLSEMIGIYGAVVASTVFVWQWWSHRQANLPQLTVRWGTPIVILKSDRDFELIGRVMPLEEPTVIEPPNRGWVCRIEIVNSGRTRAQLIRVVMNHNRSLIHLSDQAGLPRWLEPGERLETWITTDADPYPVPEPKLDLRAAGGDGDGRSVRFHPEVPADIRVGTSTGREFRAVLTPGATRIYTRGHGVAHFVRLQFVAEEMRMLGTLPPPGEKVDVRTGDKEDVLFHPWA